MAEGETQGALEWSIDETELLIDTIREAKILYEVRSEDNKNAGKKELEWLNISEVVGKDLKECKKKWTYLRGQFSKLHKKKKGKSGDGRKSAPTWPFYEQLLFLSSHISGHNNTSGNMQHDIAAEDDEIEGNDRSFHEEDAAQGNVPQSKKVKTSEKLDNALLGYLSKKQQKDSIHHFCMSLADNMRKMPDAQIAYAQMRISQMMYEVQYPQFTQPAPANHESSEINSDATGLNFTNL